MDHHMDQETEQKEESRSYTEEEQKEESKSYTEAELELKAYLEEIANSGSSSRETFWRGMLCGWSVMLAVIGIILFTRGEINKRRLVMEQTALERETDALTDYLDLDMDHVERKLENIEEVVNQYYLDEIDQKEVESWMYKGLIAGLGDAYADYYTKEELEKTNEASNGSYEGIGAVLTQSAETGIVTITRCYEGTPSAEAGLLPGDVIYSINGEPVTGEELSDVVSQIKTEPGETVQIQVAREGENDYITFEVARAPIEIPTVNHEMLEGKIGYIEVTEFDVITEEQFKMALDDLEAQGMEKLIIDLRNNPGGVLSTVCNMLEQILPEGLIVYTEDKAGNRSEYKSSGEHEFTKPLAVLINGNSASASEIFAGAVKDYGIGTLVGTTTFGKGIVQRIVMLNDGTAVKLTVSNYFTPKGNNIHKKGIEPDVEVELDEELKQKVTIEKSEDNQLQKAIEVLEQK